MQIGLRDWIATVLVLAGVGVALAWWASLPVVETFDVRTVSILVTAMGMLASASAVVPGFSALVHGSRSYLAGTSIVGTLALVAAGVAIVNADERALAVLVIASVVLWIVSTMRHMGALASATSGARP
jgi:hypothetical protein